MAKKLSSQQNRSNPLHEDHIKAIYAENTRLQKLQNAFGKYNKKMGISS